MSSLYLDELLGGRRIFKENKNCMELRPVRTPMHTPKASEELVSRGRKTFPQKNQSQLEVQPAAGSRETPRKSARNPLIPGLPDPDPAPEMRTLRRYQHRPHESMNEVFSPPVPRPAPRVPSPPASVAEASCPTEVPYQRVCGL